MNYSFIETLLNQKWLMSREHIVSSLASLATQIYLKQDLSEQKRHIQLINIFDADTGKKVDPTNQIPDNAVAVIDLVGTIVRQGNYAYWGADEITNLLRLADQTASIKATILRTNCYGGAADAMPVFQEFFAEKTKPVLMWYNNKFSLAEWIGAHCDFRMASDDLTAMCGSIGALSVFQDWNAAMEKLIGLKTHTVQSNLSPDKGKAMMEATNGLYDILKEEHLDPLALAFRNSMQELIPNIHTEDGVLTGKVFYYKDALQYGLTDGKGTFKEALQVALTLTEINH